MHVTRISSFVEGVVKTVRKCIASRSIVSFSLVIVLLWAPAVVPRRVRSTSPGFSPGPLDVSEGRGARCPSDCNSANGKGTCDNGRCRCIKGYGSVDCTFTHSTIYQNQVTYEGFNISQNFKPFDLQGWSVSAPIYHEYLKTVDAVTIIEVGVWKGRSASHMAQWLDARESGLLIAIDTWLGAPEFWAADPMRGADKKRDLMLVHGYPTVYYQFLSNVLHQQLENVIVPLPLPSALAATVLQKHNIVADFIHIDAAHEYESVWADIRLWWKFLGKGGILMGDDYDGGWPGVIQAADEFAALCQMELVVDSREHPRKWLVKKPYASNSVDPLCIE